MSVDVGAIYYICGSLLAVVLVAGAYIWAFGQYKDNRDEGRLMVIAAFLSLCILFLRHDIGELQAQVQQFQSTNSDAGQCGRPAE